MSLVLPSGDSDQNSSAEPFLGFTAMPFLPHSASHTGPHMALEATAHAAVLTRCADQLSGQELEPQEHSDVHQPICAP